MVVSHLALMAMGTLASQLEICAFAKLNFAVY